MPVRISWLCILALALPLMSAATPTSERAQRAQARVQSALTTQLRELGADWGAPLYLRIFKAEGQLEVWTRGGERWQLLHTYPICYYSGALGPKQRQGDGQSPEGFYAVASGQLNPQSNYHLAFNLGYPNAYDRAHQRTGNYLMVHGNCVSIGCYAMGDANIEEIYSLVAAALAAGQRNVPVHVFPFRFEPGWEARYTDSPWLDFWQQLEAGYRAFDANGRPPQMQVRDGRYELVE